jgi:hypothetical protein
LPAGEQAVQARPAAQVQHGLTGTDFAQAQRVAGAAEGFRHRRRQGLDLLRLVAQLLGAAWADRELHLLTGRAGDLGEALLHGGTDFFSSGRHRRFPAVLDSLAFGIILREGPTKA